MQDEAERDSKNLMTRSKARQDSNYSFGNPGMMFESGGILSRNNSIWGPNIDLKKQESLKKNKK